MDHIEEALKKKYERQVVDLLIGRTCKIEDISDARKKNLILDEALIFYRDHIRGSVGSDASHHDVGRRFPGLNEEIRVELSRFSEKMYDADQDMAAIEAVIKEFGINVSFATDRFRSSIR